MPSTGTLVFNDQKLQAPEMYATESLGVGVSVPTSNLEVVGNAYVSSNLDVGGSLGLTKGSSLFAGDSVVMETSKHDRPLVKYPEVAMTASTVGGYTVSEPTNTFHGNSSFRLWTAFNNDTSTPDWETMGGCYDTGTRDPQTSGSYVVTTVASGTTYYGVYAQMLAPIRVKVSHVDIRPQNTYGLERLPGIAVFVGSNDGTTWTLIRSVTNNSGALNTYTRYNVNATQAYRYIRIIWNKLTTAGTNTSYRNRAAASEIKIFGTEEGDVSTDVTLSSVYNKPGTEHLEVYYDGQDYTSMPSTITDKSGNGVTGTPTNVTFDSTWKAFSFDGSGDYIEGTLGNPGGDYVHSVSWWFKPTQTTQAIGTNEQTMWFMGNTWGAGVCSYSSFYADTFYFAWHTYNINCPTTNISQQQWNHACVTYTGGGSSLTSRSIYINGVKQYSSLDNTQGQLLNLPANTYLLLGNQRGQSKYFNGSIANFRLFSKALNAEQVKELYDYQKDYFLGSRSSLTIHKGNLGLGVAEPTSRLEIAGNERFQEYPPRAMTGFETYMEGHGVFRVSASSFINNSYIPYKAFDKNLYNAWLNKNNSSNSRYLGTDHLYSGINGLGGYSGEWIGLKLPHSINLKTVAIHPRQVSGSYNEMPEDGVILGYDDKTGEYETLDSWVGVVLGEYEPHVRTIQTAKTYNQFFLLGTRTVSHTDNLRIGELKFFGTPAPSTLDDGKLTLGKQLTLPRVSGHAAGAETPRAESLVVHYDTTVDSVVSGATVVDTSGSGNNGTLHGVTYSVPNRTLHGDGISAGDYTKTPITISGGAMPFSISMWFRPETFRTGTSTSVLSFMGNKSSGAGVIFSYRQDAIWQDLYGKGVLFYVSLSLNTWYHVTTTYNGGNIESGSSKMYLNGVEITSQFVSGTGSVNLPTSTDLELFDYINASNDRHQGDISNFKLWDVALTADEIAAEYALGRTGKALNVTDTAVCLGGTVPRAQLDVRGTGMFDGGLVIKADNLEYARDGGITLSRAGLGTAGNEYSSQPIVLDGGDAGAVDANIRGGAIWSQWGGAQYGIAMKGASHSDTYPYLQTPTMFVTNDKVGIGTVSPGTKCHIHQSGTGTNDGLRLSKSSSQYWNIYTSSGNDLNFKYGGGPNGGYLLDTTNAGQIDFTGQHRSFIDDVPYAEYDNLEGLVVSANKNKYFDINEDITTGANAIQISQSLPLVSLSSVAKDKACFGVISGSEDPETREYAQGAFVSVAQKQKGDRRAFINSLGEGAIWVTNINGSLESGDYITTSNVAGYGMKQDSEFLANYTVAKITMDCDFEPTTQPVQQIVEELSNVNYWVETTYTDVAFEEYSNLAEENRQTVTTTRYSNDDGDISPSEYNDLDSNAQATYSEIETVTYQHIEREESTTEQEGYTLEVREELVNVLDEHGQLQWEDHPTETEKAYKIRYLTADGRQTDEANAVYIAAFVGCTYHCG